MDIKKLRELREKAASGRYGKHRNCLAVEADMIQPIVTAYHRKNLNRAMADIEYIVEACNALPEALDEIERLEKVLKSACNELVEFAGSCPPDIHLRSWGGCLGENCKNEYAECWKEYFLNRSVSP